MKRRMILSILCFTLALSMLLTLAFSKTSVAKAEKTLDAVIGGDDNGDGKVDSTDLILLKRHILKISLLEGDGLRAADRDHNGVLDATDYVYLKNALINIYPLIDDEITLPDGEQGKGTNAYGGGPDDGAATETEAEYAPTLVAGDTTAVEYEYETTNAGIWTTATVMYPTGLTEVIVETTEPGIIRESEAFIEPDDSAIYTTDGIPNDVKYFAEINSEEYKLLFIKVYEFEVVYYFVPLDENSFDSVTGYEVWVRRIPGEEFTAARFAGAVDEGGTFYYPDIRVRYFNYDGIVYKVRHPYYDKNGKDIISLVQNPAYAEPETTVTEPAVTEPYTTETEVTVETGSGFDKYPIEFSSADELPDDVKEAVPYRAESVSDRYRLMSIVLFEDRVYYYFVPADDTQDDWQWFNRETGYRVSFTIGYYRPVAELAAEWEIPLEEDGSFYDSDIGTREWFIQLENGNCYIKCPADSGGDYKSNIAIVKN